MEKLDLKNEILELIERHAEGEYWDFKQQWHSNNVDLLHDIICMANSPANRDCYIIIGVEDKTYNVLGVNDEHRKNQQNVINLLHQSPTWAGGYIPEVYVKTISIMDKVIDVVVIKQSNNTPFYLLEDYEKDKKKILKGVIYTRKADTNTPKTQTADLYDTELLWKRRFGLLYNPSQRAKNYLKDLDNWSMVNEKVKRNGIDCLVFYYQPDPDYTVCIVYENNQGEKTFGRKSVNDDDVGPISYYLFAFCDLSYNTDYSIQRKVLLYYKEIPLFESIVECIDQGNTMVVPPEHDFLTSHFIRDSFRYLLFEFLFANNCDSHSEEAKEMFLRVVPRYHTEDECEEFEKYIRDKGYKIYKSLKEEIGGEALQRLSNTIIEKYDNDKIPNSIEQIAKKLDSNKDLVINFASTQNRFYNQIDESLKNGKMLVDWLKEWSDFNV